MNAPCKPYGKNRTGINIGEVAASVLVTYKSISFAKKPLKFLGEASCNDANHISGPSRTGEGLVQKYTVGHESRQILICNEYRLYFGTWNSNHL